MPRLDEWRPEKPTAELLDAIAPPITRDIAPLVPTFIRQWFPALSRDEAERLAADLKALREMADASA